jgi:Uma2 family endonuclease
MASATISRPSIDNLADLVERLGCIPLERIRTHPAPGTATEKDVLSQLDNGMKRVCELVDGVLVEKPMGYYESWLASILMYFLGDYLKNHDLGILVGEAGTIRLRRGLVRYPDVGFISWDQFPNRELPDEQIPDLYPDLAVEVLSPGNTEKEMARKRREYFAAGTRLDWEVYPKQRKVRVYTSAEQYAELGENQKLDGGEVLPGFALRIKDWFARAGRRGVRNSSRRPKQEIRRKRPKTKE